MENQEVQQRILTKAGELFFRFGIRSVTMDDIAREMGMSKKTLYVQFSTKDDLVEAMLSANIQQMHERTEQWLTNRTLTQALREYVERLAAEKGDVRHVPQLVYDLQKYYPAQFAAFHEKAFAHQLEFLQKILRQGIQEGIVRADLDVDTVSVLLAKIHSDAIRDREYIEQKGINITYFSHLALELMARGILTKEGLELMNFD